MSKKPEEKENSVEEVLDGIFKGFANDIVDALNGESGGLEKKYGSEITGLFNDIFTGDPKERKKRWQDEDYEKYVATFASTIPLWKLKDKQWVEHRKNVWARMLAREMKDCEKRNDFNKSYWGQAERYFLRAKPRKSDSKLYDYRRMAYTPYSCVEEIVSDYMKCHVSLRRGLHTDLLRYASNAYRAVPDEFHRVELIAEALYNNDYVAKKDPIGTDKKLKYSVSYPRGFIISYGWEASTFIHRSKIKSRDEAWKKSGVSWDGQERSYSEITIDYFIANVEYAVRSGDDSYGSTINDTAIDSIQKLCDRIESYAPDIDNPHRDKFIASARELILDNPDIKKIRKAGGVN